MYNQARTGVRGKRVAGLVHAGTPHLPTHQPTREPPLPLPVAGSPVAVGA